MAESYGSNGGLSKPAQEVMSSLGDEVCVQRKMNPIEILGIEGKNTYELFQGHTTKGQSIGWTKEESGCCDRICFGPGRELTFTTHQGSEEGPVVTKLHKERHWPCFACCSRPHATLSDGEGHALGKIEDPCSCCCFNHNLIDANGKQRYTVSGSCCQCGVCCPCCADVTMQIHEEGKEVGSMKRLMLNFTEICCPTSRFAVKFPTGCANEDKALILASQLMMDVTYFDTQQDNGDPSPMDLI